MRSPLSYIIKPTAAWLTWGCRGPQTMSGWKQSSVLTDTADRRQAPVCPGRNTEETQRPVFACTYIYIHKCLVYVPCRISVMSYVGMAGVQC